MKYHQYPEIPKSQVTDLTLLGQVNKAFADSADVDLDNINVDVQNGIVYLTGIAKTLYEKKIAGKLARSIRGVRDVDNDIAVSTDHVLTDEQVQEALDRALGNYPEGSAEKIGVRLVQNGTAYLAGKASNALEAWNAVDIAARVPGVVDIVNEIDVAPGYPVDDIEIKNGVIDALSEDSRVDPFEIQVYVEDAEVYLNGEVEDEEAVQAAGELASSAPGVKRVINHLRKR